MNVPAPHTLLPEATAQPGAGTDSNASRQDTPRDLFAQLLAQGPQLAARSPGTVAGSAGEAVFEIGAPTPGAQDTRLGPRSAPADDAQDDPHAGEPSETARTSDDSDTGARETVEAPAAPVHAPVALDVLPTPARTATTAAAQVPTAAAPATTGPQPSDAPNAVQAAATQSVRPMPVDSQLPSERPRADGVAAGLEDVQVTVSDRSTQLTSRPTAALTSNAATAAAQIQTQPAAPTAATATTTTAQSEVAAPATAAEPTVDDGAASGQQTRLTLAGVAAQNSHPGQTPGPAQPQLPGPTVGPAAAVVAPVGAQTGGQGFDANLSRFGQGGQQSTSGSSGQGSAPAAGSPSATSFASLTGPQAAQAPTRSAAANPLFARQVQNQVAVHITRAAAQGLDKIAIQLKPQDLGRIDVKMELGGDGQVRASVLVEKPETLELLQRDARGLERALADAGLKTGGDGLQFSLRGEGGAGHGARGDGADGAASRTASADAAHGTDSAGPTDVALGVNLRAAEGGMDMRV